MAVGSELPVYLAQLIQTVHKIEELFPMSYDSVKVEMVPHISTPCIPPKCYPSYKTCSKAEPGSHTCPHGYQFSECCPQGLHDMYDVAPSLLPWIPTLSCKPKDRPPWKKTPISPAPDLIPEIEQFITRLGVNVKLEIPHVPRFKKPQPYTFMQPGHETIHTFPVEYFENAEDYYAVLLHEVGHWSAKLSKRDNITNPIFMALMGHTPEEFVAENICIKLFEHFKLAPRSYWCGRLALYDQDTSLVRMKTQLYEYVEQATEVLLRYPDTPTYIVTREGKRI